MKEDSQIGRDLRTFRVRKSTTKKKENHCGTFKVQSIHYTTHQKKGSLDKFPNIRQKNPKKKKSNLINQGAVVVARKSDRKKRFFYHRIAKNIDVVNCQYTLTLSQFVFIFFNSRRYLWKQKRFCNDRALSHLRKNNKCRRSMLTRVRQQRKNPSRLIFYSKVCNSLVFSALERCTHPRKFFLFLINTFNIQRE